MCQPAEFALQRPFRFLIANTMVHTVGTPHHCVCWIEMVAYASLEDDREFAIRLCIAAHAMMWNVQGGILDPSTDYDVVDNPKDHRRPRSQRSSRLGAKTLFHLLAHDCPRKLCDSVGCVTYLYVPMLIVPRSYDARFHIPHFGLPRDTSERSSRCP